MTRGALLGKSMLDQRNEHLEPQSTMVTPVLDEQVFMNLPPCWMGDPGGGGAGAL